MRRCIRSPSTPASTCSCRREFGIMCPISVTDTSIYLIRKYASPQLKDYLLPRMLSGDLATMWKGTQFMTEKAGGSDIGAIETVAAQRGRHLAALWREVVLLAHGRRRGPDPRPSRRRARRHQGPRPLRPAAAARGRHAQQLPDRAAEGQARHPLHGLRRDPPRRCGGLPRRPARPGPQADDGPGQPVAPVARGAGRRHDAPLPQRGADRGAPPRRLRQARHRASAGCAGS